MSPLLVFGVCVEEPRACVRVHKYIAAYVYTYSFTCILFNTALRGDNTLREVLFWFLVFFSFNAQVSQLVASV